MAKRKSRKKRSSKGFKKKLLFFFLIVIGIGVFFVKDVPVEYYPDTEGKGLKGAALKTAIHDMIRKHEYLNFEQNTTARYWWDNYFKETDWHTDGYYNDMYSKEKNARYISGNVQSREHCMPRSWWGVRDKYPSYDANGDLHNIFPSDYSANSAKGNLPLGEVGISSFDNGVSKVGINTYPKGYKGQVFEPADEYKGDFARVYFYMVTCYEDYSYDWKSPALKSMLQKGTYPAFQSWAQDMLLKWHREDPVSEKEIKRNAAVFRIQGNRNPFIDYPDLAEYVWGNKTDEPFNSLENKPVIKENSITHTYNELKNKIEELLKPYMRYKI